MDGAQRVSSSSRQAHTTCETTHPLLDCIIADCTTLFFCYSVFILCLTLCIIGCGWNYFKEGSCTIRLPLSASSSTFADASFLLHVFTDKRGWEIVPLYESATNCYDKYRGTSRNWTPQMDSATTGRSTRSTYGADDDSGTSYQSNL